MLCSLPSLTLPVPRDTFLLQTDASGVGLGAVLSVVRADVEWPVAYFSKKLQPRETRYSATELEGLAVVAAVTHFDAYLITHPFTIETDHRALQFLNTANHSNGRIARWALRLQPYTFNIKELLTRMLMLCQDASLRRTLLPQRPGAQKKKKKIGEML